MKLIGVRFLGRTLLFSRSFLYVLILINLFINVKKFANFLDNFFKKKGGKAMLEELLEHIAKSLESIDAELKARNEDRKFLLEQAEVIEKTCLDIKKDPFGLNGLKRKALADRVKQKE